MCNKRHFVTTVEMSPLELFSLCFSCFTLGCVVVSALYAYLGKTRGWF